VTCSDLDVMEWPYTSSRCVFLFCFAYVVALALGCEPPYCDNPDFGSCGNACCKLEFLFKEVDTVDLKDYLNSTIHAGGPDGLYVPAPMALSGSSGIKDHRMYSSPIDFIGQTYHYTSVAHWQDTIDFTISPEDSEDSKLLMFSISDIGGAYGDSGQNYNNIMQLVSSLGLDYSMKHVDDSCPASS